jgi:hypothetical protein
MSNINFFRVMSKGTFSETSNLISLCYNEDFPSEACSCTSPYALMGNTNMSQSAVISSFIPSYWDRFGVPINSLYTETLPGVQIPDPYYIYGASYGTLKNNKLYVPPEDVENIQVTVTADRIRTSTSSVYSYVDAVLYWCVADVNDDLPGIEYKGTSDGIPFYGINDNAVTQFPDSPYIDSWNGGNIPIYNAEYTDIVPVIHNGEALYVFWYCSGNNYSNFDYAAFTTINMRISITQL